MDVFELRGRLVGDYANYTRSVIKLARIRPSGLANIVPTVESDVAGSGGPD